MDFVTRIENVPCVTVYTLYKLYSIHIDNVSEEIYIDIKILTGIHSIAGWLCVWLANKLNIALTMAWPGHSIPFPSKWHIIDIKQ